jgi:hypothetical protein
MPPLANLRSLTARFRGQSTRRTGGFVSLALSIILTAFTGIGLGEELLSGKLRDQVYRLFGGTLSTVALLSLFFGFWLTVPILLIACVNLLRRRVHWMTKIGLWLMVPMSLYFGYKTQIYLQEHLR